MAMMVRAKAIVSEKKSTAMTVMAQMDMMAPRVVAWMINHWMYHLLCVCVCVWKLGFWWLRPINNWGVVRREQEVAADLLF